MSSPVVETHGLRVELLATGEDVVDEVGLTIRAGEVLGLVGESGSGKTTVAMALLGHVRRGGHITAGSIRVAGDELRTLGEEQLRKLRGTTVAYIPQDPGTALNPALRIGTQLREVLRGWRAPDAAARISEALEEVALVATDELLGRYPHQLSGGQQQRIAIAMAFARRPAVVVCDEPTTGLDVTTQARVLATLKELCLRHQVAALYVSHDLAVVAELADRVAVMYAGRIVETGPREEIFADPRHPYTRRLLRAVPDIGGTRKIVGIGGYAPLPGQRPSGCSFHPRCSFAIDRCAAEVPPSVQFAAVRAVRCLRFEEDEALAPAEIRQQRDALVEDPAGALLRVEALQARYGSKVVLPSIDLVVGRDECLAVVGESGSGKTTLASCLGGLHDQWSGTALFDGKPLGRGARSRDARTRREIQYVFQNPYASLNPRRTVGQTIARQLELFGLTAKHERDAKVAEALERVALSARAATRYPDQLSGGERQRVAIARALVVSPRLLICDEVTSALDVSVQAAVVDLLGQLRAELRLSLIFITHDLALVPSVADRVMVMKDGTIVEQGATRGVFAAPASDYAKLLLASTPSLDPEAGQQGPEHISVGNES